MIVECAKYVILSLTKIAERQEPRTTSEEENLSQSQEAHSDDKPQVPHILQVTPPPGPPQIETGDSPRVEQVDSLAIMPATHDPLDTEKINCDKEECQETSTVEGIIPPTPECDQEGCEEKSVEVLGLDEKAEPLLGGCKAKGKRPAKKTRRQKKSKGMNKRAKKRQRLPMESEGESDLGDHLEPSGSKSKRRKSPQKKKDKRKKSRRHRAAKHKRPPKRQTCQNEEEEACE